ncbi:MAG: hypothetical protein R8K46_07555 [Mariprofundaceae bacterium]
MGKKFGFILMVIVMVMAYAEISLASCGSGQCNLNEQGGGRAGLGAKSWLFDANFTVLSVNRPRQGSKRTPSARVFEEGNSAANSTAGGEPAVEEISTTTFLTTVSLTYALTDTWTASVSQPFVSRDHIHINDPDGVTAEGRRTLINPLKGFGDLSLQTRYAIPSTVIGGNLGFGFGVKFATGDDTIPDQEGVRNDSTLQPGTGSTDYNFTIDARAPLGMDWWIFADATYRIRGSNGFGYNYGNDTLGSIGLGWHAKQFKVGRLGFVQAGGGLDVSVQLDYRHIPHDFGQVNDAGNIGQRPSTGGDHLFIAPGGRLNSGDGFSYYAYVQLPLYQRVNDQQLSSRFNMRIGISQIF